MSIILVKLPDRGVFRAPDGVTEYIDTWGSMKYDEAIECAKRLTESQGKVGEEYEIIEVIIKRKKIIKAKVVGVEVK